MFAPSSASPEFVYTDSETTVLQTELEDTIREIYLKNGSNNESMEDARTSSSLFTLKRKKHVEYCLRNIRELHPTYISLNSSRTWIVYWLVHSLGVLGELELDEDLQTDVVQFYPRANTTRVDLVEDQGSWHI